ncbi:transcriptional regulator [Aurantiacibacter xanthus]|uniref:Transcriptional regulator n=1 Tax=Aurantiacibacter xanthus TaxID=1784712 RepID=A0A3A1P507_9SPHN|nr:helix-turn-helix domain-containing protein [Aurantiacibacter xanthus]RIV82231.1 transcriptional regulator [Aurantiacibacter xanthus]
MESGLSKREVEQREVARHASECALEDWLSFLGHRWNGLILWRLSSGSRSFTELSSGLSGITPKVLTERLASLTEKGLVERSQGASFPRTTAYALTEHGKDLADHLQRFYRWATENPLAQNAVACQR